MRDVELVEGDERTGATTPSSADASPGDGSARRRRARRWWLLATVLVVVLVVTSIVQDRRDQARLVRLAAVPGVLAPVGGPVHGLWTTPVATTAAIMDVHDVGGVLVGGWTSPDGGSAARGVDARTGTEVWSVPLAAAGVPSWGCVTTQGPVTGQDRAVLVCEVVDASVTEMLGTTNSTHATAVHVVVLDPRTGTVLRRLPADVQGSFATIGADVVRATTTDNGVDVTRLDPRTGRTAWTAHLTADSRYAGTVRPVWVQGLGGGLLVQADAQAWELDPTGGVVRVGTAPPPAGVWEFFRTAGGDMVRFGFPSPQTSGDLTYTVLATGATFTPPAARPPSYGVDDGSAPNVLLSLGPTMTAWDLRTGQQRWRGEGSITTALILDGTVYSVGAGIVHAQDAQTGHALWSVDTKTRGANDLATDGRTLLVLTGNDTATSTLRSLDLTDGHEQWQTQLPVAAQSLQVITGRLFASTLDGTLALG
jgi:hypothetical protein